MRLLPQNRDHGWAPFIWLAYFGFFFLDPILSHAGWKQWLATGLGTVAFLILYFGIYWLRRPWDLVDLGVMVLMGVGFAPWNAGATCFFIYAAALLPFVVETELLAVQLLGVIAGDCRPGVVVPAPLGLVSLLLGRHVGGGLRRQHLFCAAYAHVQEVAPGPG